MVLSIGRRATGAVTLSQTVRYNIPPDAWVKDEIHKVKDHAAQDLMVLAEDTIIIAKSIVHVITGALQRSIKADRPSEVRDRTSEAESRDLGRPVPFPERVDKNKMALAVGGTTFYAIFEELKHPYMEPAVLLAQANLKRHFSRGA